MPRVPLQDVIRPGRRSIRNVAIHRHTNTTRRTLPAEKSADEETLPPPPIYNQETARGWRRNGFLWCAAVGAVALLLFVTTSLVFAGATVIVTPRTAPLTVDGTFSAHKNSGFGELSFETMTFSREKSKEVPSAGEEHVESKASGRIVVYNNFSGSAQKLVANTRFETPSGLIFRIKDAAIIPGQKKQGTTVTPGSLEVTVYADAVGEKYNIDLNDFVLPGFKGKTQYSSIYARSKTPMSGGFSGTRKVAKAEDIAAAHASLEESLRQQLMGEAGAEIPEGFVLFPQGSFLSFANTSPPEDTEQKKERVTITVRGTFTGIIFEEKMLAHYLAQQSISDYDGAEVILHAPESLTFALLSKETMVPSALTNITFTLKGITTLIWSFDENRLREDLAGKYKKITPGIFSAYPGIKTARVIVRPFWKTQLPEKAADIRLKNDLSGL